jgi:hypothetical protein
MGIVRGQTFGARWRHIGGEGVGLVLYITIYDVFPPLLMYHINLKVVFRTRLLYQANIFI